MKFAKVSGSKQIGLGAVISYCLLALDIAFALFIPKWINNVIGVEQYGVYTLLNSAISMFLVDFGLSNAVTKFLSKYIAKNDIESGKKLLGIVYKLYFVVDFIILCCFLFYYLFIDKIAGNLSEESLASFKYIFPIMAIYNLIAFPCITFNSILTSKERFVVLKGSAFLQKLLYMLFLILVLSLKLNLLFICLSAVVSGLLILIFKYFYIRKTCDLKPDMKYMDKSVLKSIFSFSIWVTLSAISSKILHSLLPTVLASVSNEQNIAVYGYAYALVSNMYSLSTVFSSMSIPKVTRLVEKNTEGSRKELDEYCIHIGRIQGLVVFLFFSGFIMFGQSFITLLMGSAYNDSYYCFVLLFIPNLLTVCLGIAEAASIVLNTIKIRAIASLVCSVASVGLSYWLGSKYGAIGVCFACFIFSTILSLFEIFFVYGYKQKMKIIPIQLKIYTSFVPSLAASVFVALLLKRIHPINSWLVFLLYCSLFSIVFVFLFLFVGVDKATRISIFKKMMKKNISKKLFYKKNSDYLLVNNKVIPVDKKIMIVHEKIDFKNIEYVSHIYGSSFIALAGNSDYFLYTNDTNQMLSTTTSNKIIITTNDCYEDYKKLNVFERNNNIIVVAGAVYEENI